MFEHRIIKKILILFLCFYVGYYATGLTVKRKLYFESRNQIKDELNNFIYHDSKFRDEVKHVPKSKYDIVIYNRVAKCGEWVWLKFEKEEF